MTFNLLNDINQSEVGISSSNNTTRSNVRELISERQDCNNKDASHNNNKVIVSSTSNSTSIVPHYHPSTNKDEILSLESSTSKENHCYLYLSAMDEHLLFTNNNNNDPLPLPLLLLKENEEDININNNPMTYLENVNSYKLLDDDNGEMAKTDLLDDDDLLSAPLLPIVVSSKGSNKDANSTTPPWWKWKIPADEKKSSRSRYFVLISFLLFVTFLCMIETIKPEPCSLDDDYYDDDSSVPEPASNRTFYATRCGTKLSEINTNNDINPSSPQGIAIEWFVSGEGRFIELPVTLDDCAWNTTFGTFYALVVTRESLNVMPWKSYNNTVTNISDACNHWSRISCNDENTVITKLHLNHANLTGEIPKEISGLTNLERLEMYSNNITGVIPSEIGNTMSQLKNLYLHRTYLSGGIPDSLGNLYNLQELFLDHNINLKGSVPESVCNLRSKNLHLLHADCVGVPLRVSCDCCDGCYHS